MYEFDALIAGLLGGFFGGVVVVIVMYFNFQSQLREYIFASENFKTRNVVMKLMDDVAVLKIQVASLNSESYHAVTEDHYK